MELQDLESVHLKVTNNSTETIRGRHNGIDYTWRPGKSLVISGLAANHIFGFGEDDKSRAMNRLGWAPRSDLLELAFEKLAQVDFEEIQQVFRLKRPKTATQPGDVRSSTAGAAGSEGEGQPSPNGPDDDQDEFDPVDEDGDEAQAQI